ncbi:hypothetical protein DXG03_004315, partial [Asterophora parasitica]
TVPQAATQQEIEEAAREQGDGNNGGMGEGEILTGWGVAKTKAKQGETKKTRPKKPNGKQPDDANPPTVNPFAALAPGGDTQPANGGTHGDVPL